MMLDTLRALERSEATPADASVPVARLDTQEDATAVVAWFTADRARSRIRLVIDGEAAGCLERRVLLSAVTPRVLGTGDSGRLELPGEVTAAAWEFIDLECPHENCPERYVVAPSFSPAAPPHCRVHPDAELRLRA